MHPYLPEERKQSASGWLKSLARALEQCLDENAKTLIKHKELSSILDNDALITPIAIRIDKMAHILKLEPVFSKSGRLKHKLPSISHHEIAAVHVICPTSV